MKSKCGYFGEYFDRVTNLGEILRTRACRHCTFIEYA